MALPDTPDLFKSPSRPAGRLIPAALVLGALAACGGGAGGQQGGGGQMPPAAVGVVQAQPSEVQLRAELPGRLEAVRTAQVRARVTGIVKKRLFTEGGLVKAGQPLFEIESDNYRALLDSALATQAKAEAALANARATLDRNQPLAEAKAISQQEWVSTQTAHQQAVADVAAAKAAVSQARLNLQYTQVLAPISGRIGRAGVSEGALVSPSDTTLLATIQQVDTLYVNVTQSATDVMRLKRALGNGQLKAGGAQAQVLLEDGSVHPQPARLLFTDLSVDPTSGQVALRAEVPNPKGDLLPGLFVRVRLDQGSTAGAMLLPQQAVSRGAAGDTVLVVAADGQVAQRAVRLGGAQGSQWIVLDGLKAGEQVVVDGFQKIRPKAPVKPVPWTPVGQGEAAPGAPAAASAPAPAASR